MESSSKRRAQDDLASPRRLKFRRYQFHRSLFPIHEAGSFHDSVVNALPPVAQQFSPAEDKENLDPNPIECRYDTDRRCSRRNPLQEHSMGTNADSENYGTGKYRECCATDGRELYTIDTEPDPVEYYKPLQEHTDTEADDSNTNKNGECWVTHDGELYATDIGPLARSSHDELKTLKWLRSKDGVSTGEYHLSISFDILLTKILSLRHLDNCRMRFRDIYPHFYSTTAPAKCFRGGCDPAGTKTIAYFDTLSTGSESHATVD
ncbi:hypothetical protein OEA41_008689 [Lepraria neglecta]|uniref:Uncharacterized protein n=1 Tax=Lepraria neglecta TaxID=209136 RepID=A0AAD9Z0L1_9LECA|nr:hypothetical protein OEA41_008689 [Lepraria neglecta]